VPAKTGDGGNTLVIKGDLPETPGGRGRQGGRAVEEIGQKKPKHLKKLTVRNRDRRE